MSERPQEHDGDSSRRLVISDGDAGDRLDRAVAAWRGLSRAAALRLLDAGGLKCNGRAVGRGDKGRLLAGGDVLSLEPEFSMGEAPRPDAEMPLDVLCEAPGWMIVNKPPGVPVRPHALNETGTIINAVAGRYPGVVGVGEGGLRSGVVHRLDNDTSGALLVATDQQAWRRWREAFDQRRVSKHYLALVHGLPQAQGTSELHLRVAQHKPARVVVCDEASTKESTGRCSLAWRVVERFGKHATLIDVDLHTGFLHQVRVMMHHLGHPVVGDPQYGDAPTRYGAPRQMLHAESIELDEVSARAPLPGDFQRVLEELRLG